MTHRDVHEDRKGSVWWKSDGVQEHGANSDNSNKSDVLRPHTVSSSVCASHPNSSHTPLKTWNLCRQLNLLTFATPLPLPTRSGTPVERGSDTATEGKGRLRRCISNAREQDGWWRLQWKQRVFTSQRIPNSLFSPCTTNLSHSVQLLPKAGSNYCPELLSLVWLLLSPLKPQRRLFMFCFSVF